MHATQITITMRKSVDQCARLDESQRLVNEKTRLLILQCNLQHANILFLNQIRFSHRIAADGVYAAVSRSHLSDATFCVEQGIVPGILANEGIT